jgi:hypothetical protein
MKITNRQQFLLILTISVVALLLIDHIVYTPLENLWTGRQKQIAELRKEIKDGKSVIRHEAVTRGDWANMQTNALPNDVAKAQELLVHTLHDWAEQSGAVINGILPQWKDEDDYRTIDCRVDLSGPLSALNQFLYHVESGPMGLKLESLDLTTKDANGSQLAMGLQISGLVLLPQASESQ